MSNLDKCKRCQCDKTKITAPESTAKNVIRVDEEGKRWLGRICPDCVASYARERRHKVAEFPEMKCGGCSKVFKPKTHRTKECSPKCHMRVVRKGSGS